MRYVTGADMSPVFIDVRNVTAPPARERFGGSQTMPDSSTNALTLRGVGGQRWHRIVMQAVRITASEMR